MNNPSRLTKLVVLVTAFFSIAFVVFQEYKHNDEMEIVRELLKTETIEHNALKIKYKGLEEANKDTENDLVEWQNVANGYKFQLDALNNSNGWDEDE